MDGLLELSFIKKEFQFETTIMAEVSIFYFTELFKNIPLYMIAWVRAPQSLKTLRLKLPPSKILVVMRLKYILTSYIRFDIFAGARYCIWTIYEWRVIIFSASSSKRVSPNQILNMWLCASFTNLQYLKAPTFAR